MLLTKERELKDAVREGRDRVRRFGFVFSLFWQSKAKNINLY